MSKISVLDPFSILVINKSGLLFRLHCPFNVICLVEIDSYKKGSSLSVEMVSEASTNKILYRINGKYHKHSLFELHVKL